MTSPASAATENRLVGIAWMLATMLCFITLDAIMKYGMSLGSLVQVTWGRFFFATLFAAIVCGRDLPRLARSDSPKIQLLRSVFLMVTTGLFNLGIAQVPLAEATTIMFLGPIILTILSIFVLGELVGYRRWLGIVLGFIGAIIVIAPWQGGLSGIKSGTVFLLAAAFTNACYQITTRQLRHDEPLTSLLFTAAAGALVSSAILPWHFTMPDTLGWSLLMASGLAGLVGHLCIIQAFRAAPASVVAPFSYSSLVWATLFGFVIWGDWPQANTWIGAALIVCSGLYIAFRERKVRLAAI
jgi:drug/metabolite transporter (DMT)-like permease